MQTHEEITELLRAGGFAEAERRLREEIQSDSTNSDALLLLAISVHHQGRLEEALGMYRELTERHPESSIHWGNYGTALHEAGRIEEARQAFEAALLHPPVEADTLLSYGLFLFHQEAYVEAHRVLRKAHSENLQSVEIALATAKASNACGDYRTDELLARWREWLPLDDEKQLELARLLLTAGQAQAASELIEAVDRRTPDSPRTMLRLADTYERVNRLTEAEALLNRIEAAGSPLDETLRGELAHQRASLATRKKDFVSAKALLLDAGMRHRRDFEHWFVLGRVLDKLGETRAAMDAFAQAHTRQAEEIKAVAPQLFDHDSPPLQQAVPRVSAVEYAAWPELVAPDEKDSPVFVVGFPRSGTTLLEQMLDAHPRLQSMDERPFFNLLAYQLEDYGARIPEDLGNLSQRDCDELRKGYLIMACGKVPRQWGARLVDKNPLNMLWMPMIHRLFPNAKWILALRHPCDVVLSCYMQSFRANVLAAACSTLDRLARAYVGAMENWLHHVEVFKPTILVSRYEFLIDDTPTHLQRIAQFVGLDDAGPMLRFNEHAQKKGFIATPSYSQVVEPINTRAKGRWMRYREYFEPILPILRSMLEHWGYQVDGE